MARLLSKSYPMTDLFPFSEALLKKCNAEFNKLCAERDVISFPVADNYAHYIVVSRKPLTLQHVAYMDSYHVHEALIRGLRLADVDDMIRREKAMHELFASKK